MNTKERKEYNKLYYNKNQTDLKRRQKERYYQRDYSIGKIVIEHKRVVITFT